jgi:hypothetical protein
MHICTTQYGWSTHATFDGEETICGHYVKPAVHCVFTLDGVVSCEICRKGIRLRLVVAEAKVEALRAMLAARNYDAWIPLARAKIAERQVA